MSLTLNVTDVIRLQIYLLIVGDGLYMSSCGSGRGDTSYQMSAFTVRSSISELVIFCMLKPNQTNEYFFECNSSHAKAVNWKQIKLTVTLKVLTSLLCWVKGECLTHTHLSSLMNKSIQCENGILSNVDAILTNRVCYIK